MTEQQLNLSGTKILNRKEQKKAEKKFTETFLSIFRPKIVMPNYEDMPIPKDVQISIMIERLILAKNEERLASETETLWYISTASLVSPLDHHWTNIMTYLCRKWSLSKKKELPDFLKEQIILDSYEEIELHNLRSWLYKKGMEAIK